MAAYAMKRLLHLLGPLIVLLVFAGAIWLLHHELRHYHYRDIRQSLSQVPAAGVWLAVALTALNYVILVGYDLLAVRSVGHPLPLGKIATASFIGYVSSYNFGTLLGGTSVRYRLYSGWGLSTIEIVKLLAVLGVTFWIGFFTLAGLVFVGDPIAVPPRFHLPFVSVRPLGIVLLLPVAVYLGLSAWRKGPLRFRDWELSVPSLRLSLCQIGVASADLLVAAGVLYVLMPPSLNIGYPHFLSVYLLGIVVIIFTHVPGGLGVFELTVLLLLSPDEPNLVLGALLLYRAVYYLLPLLAATCLLGANEFLLHKKTLQRLLGPIRQIAPMLAPWLFSLLTFVAGAMLLFSGAMPTAPERIGWVSHLLPLPVVELSHFVGSILGVVLLVLARGLGRRLDSAYWLTVLLLGAGIVFSLLKGFAYEEAAILLLLLLALAPARRHFYRQGSLLRQPLGPGWTAAVLLVAVCSVWIGLFAYKHVEYSNELWWHFSFHGDAPRFLRASVAVVAVLLTLGVIRLLGPAVPKRIPPDETELQTVTRIVAASPATYANLALLGDKMFLFDEDRTGLIMYGVSGRSWVALGDPVGPPAVRRELAWQFRELCDRNAGRTVFYQVEENTLPIYLNVGLSLVKLGEEARVPLSTFSLEGSARKGLRQTCHRCERENCSFQLVPQPEVSSLMPELKRVSDAWLSGRHTAEKRFSLGYFEPAYLQRFPAAVIRHRQEIIAFANVWCGADQVELSVDLMRYLPDAPPGVMEYLFMELMLWGRAAGYQCFNLGMAPLSGLESRTLAPLWSRVGALVFRHGEHFYHFQGLRQYKEKFGPQWRPKYLASPGGLALPRILADIATLISGGVKGLVTK
jgi:phosphatidylglycerol lysyltransferase